MAVGRAPGARRWRRSTASRSRAWSRCSDRGRDGRARQHAARGSSSPARPRTSTCCARDCDAGRGARGGRAARRAARRRAAALRVDAAGGRRAVPLAGAGADALARVRGAGPARGRRRVGAGARRRSATSARSQFVEPVRWDAVAGAIRALGADWVLDLGPGTAVARLTAENLRGSGVRTLALASPEGRRVLTVAGRRAGRARRHATRSFAPGVVELPAAAPPRHALHARHRPPAGDPRRDDADDGRRADRRRRRQRRATWPSWPAAGSRTGGRSSCASPSCAELLEPGPRGRLQHAAARPAPVGAAHRARRAAVRRAARGRAARGADRLGRASRTSTRRSRCSTSSRAEGMRVNAFKPGTAEQVRQVLAIADAAPHHTIAAHLEGGRARRAPLVGGPRGAAARDLPRAAPARRTCWCARAAGSARRSAPRTCCTGRGRCAHGEARDAGRRRARRHGRDGVPRGGRLAAGQGGAGRRGRRSAAGCRGAASTGGVTSRAHRTSTPTSTCSTTPPRAPGTCWRRSRATRRPSRARRDEIVAALALTAKPYFGDVAAMTYCELLDAVPRALRDGPRRALRRRRLGPSELARARAWRCTERFAARLDAAESGPIAVGARSRRPGRGAASVRVGVPGGGDDAAASRRRAVLPRGLRPPRQAGAVRAGPRRRGPPLVHGRRAVAGPGRPARRRRGLRHPRPARRSPASPAPTSRSPSCSPASRRRRSRALAAPPVARARLAAPGPAPAPLASSPRAAARSPRCCAAQCVVARGRPHAPEPAVAPGRPGRHDRPSTTAPSSVRPSSATRRDASTLDAPTATTRSSRSTPRPATAARARRGWPAGRAVRARGPPPPAALVTRWRAAPRRPMRRRVGGDAARAAFAAAASAPSVRAPSTIRSHGVVDGGRARPSSPRAYRAATGAAHDGVPLDLALTLAWPALDGAARVPGARRAAARARARVARGHARARRGRRAPGEAGDATARLVELADPAGAPTRLRCHARLTLRARRARRRRGRARDPRRRARDRVRAAPPRPPRPRRSRSPSPATPTSSPRSRGCS